MKRLSLFVLLLVLVGCGKPSSDSLQQAAQEQILNEAAAQTGMPAIRNFRERKIVKDLLELRDQEGLVTYTYLFSSMQGKFIFLGQSVGYGIPAAMQYTNPQKIASNTSSDFVLPQADPNGLFSPASAEGTWAMILNPDTKKVEPQYVEERICTFTFKLPKHLVIGYETLPAEATVPVPK